MHARYDGACYLLCSCCTVSMACLQQQHCPCPSLSPLSPPPSSSSLPPTPSLPLLPPSLPLLPPSLRSPLLPLSPSLPLLPPSLPPPSPLPFSLLLSLDLFHLYPAEHGNFVVRTYHYITVQPWVGFIMVMCFIHLSWVYLLLLVQIFQVSRSCDYHMSHKNEETDPT